MSITQEQIDQASALVIAEVVAPVFLEKLASYGVHPQDNEQIERLWQMGVHLKNVDDQRKLAGASAFGEQLKVAEARLYELTAQMGYGQTVPQADSYADMAGQVLADESVKQAAALLLQGAAAA